MLNKIIIAITGLLMASASFSQESASADAPQTPLPWAYALNTPGIEAEPDDGTVKHVPGSDQEFSFAETRNLFKPPDWHPADHPQMPKIVAEGAAGVFACGYCHLPNGQGRPENASLVGLSADYIVQQMADFNAGLRQSSEPLMGPPAAMLTIGRNTSIEDVRAAADYFASLAPQPWIRVIETDVVPETIIAGWMFVEVEDGRKTESIGQRILEMPEDLERTELRDAKSGFIAYVPTGSIAKGRELVTTGNNGKTISCVICHGDDLGGLGPVPALAGRSPSYLARQLYDFQTGQRRGRWSDLMQAAVANLEVEDIIAIVAYAASLEPIVRRE